MYQIRKNKPFYTSLRTLSFFFAYHGSTENRPSCFPLFVSLVIKLSFFIFIIVGSTLYVIMTLAENNGTDVSEGLSITLGCLGTLSNASMFHYHLKKWTTLFNQVTDFRKFGKPANFEKVQDRGNFFCIFYVVTCSFGAILYSIVTLFQTMCHDENLEQICGTMLPIWIPFENISPIIVKLIFTIQFILINAVVTPAAVISFFSFETTELIISHINHLKILFSDVFEDIDENIRYERLRFCIEYHIRILDMAKQLDYLVKYTMGQMSIISPLIFACLGNQIFITKPLAAGIFLMGYLISMFMQCYAGQRMTDENFTFINSVYGSKWYEGTIPMKKCIQFVMGRCQIPVTLSAWPLGVFDLPLFLMVVKASYSYLTLLRQST